MALEKFLPSSRDTWTWNLAKLDDVADIVALAQQHFENEIDAVFEPRPDLFAKHISLAVVEQAFDARRLQLIVARNKSSNQLESYAWITRGVYMTYAVEEVAEAAFAHIRMDLPLKTRLTIMAQILQQWEMWCQICCIPVLVSTTIRQDQSGFLRLHEQAGYSIRGSFAFKRIKDRNA